VLAQRRWLRRASDAFGPRAVLRLSRCGIKKLQNRCFPPRTLQPGAAAQALEQVQQWQARQQQDEAAAAEAEALAAAEQADEARLAAEAAAEARAAMLADDARATWIQASARLSLMPGPQHGVWPPDWSAEYDGPWGAYVEH
jgi:hypothetical protein